MHQGLGEGCTLYYVEQKIASNLFPNWLPEAKKNSADKKTEKKNLVNVKRLKHYLEKGKLLQIFIIMFLWN